MVIELNIEKMKIAYGLLYKVENLIRTYIKVEMENYYGIHWFQVAPRREYNRVPTKTFDSLNFPDYASYFSLYPKAFNHIPSEFFAKLRQLYSIRNKIAHNHLLTHSEFQILKQNSTYISDFTKRELLLHN